MPLIQLRKALDAAQPDSVHKIAIIGPGQPLWSHH
jgi:hypothetical protein